MPYKVTPKPVEHWLSKAIDGSFKMNAVRYRYVTRHSVNFKEYNSYALHCGIKQFINIGERHLELWHCAGAFHVRYTDWERKGESSSDIADGFSRMRSFSSLKEARFFFGIFLSIMVRYYGIEGYYDGSWERVTVEPSTRMALETVRLYRENEPQIPFRIRSFKETNNDC